MAEPKRRGAPYLGRRLLIFVLVGVPLGGLLLMLALPLAMSGALDLQGAYTSPVALPALVLLPPFWMLGTGPALLCGGIDARLAGTALTRPLRALLTGVFGGALTLLPVIGLYVSGMIGGFLPLVVGLAGMGAATACSALSILADTAGRRVENF